MSESVITPSAPDACALPDAACLAVEATSIGFWLTATHGPSWSSEYNQWLSEKLVEYRATLDKAPGVSLTLEERAGFDEWLRERVK